MAQKVKQNYKQHYRIEKTIEQIFTGQRITLDESEELIITPCHNSLVFTHFETGERVKELQLNPADVEDGDSVIDFAYRQQHLIVAYNSGLLKHYRVNIEKQEDNYDIDTLLLRTWKSMHIGPIASIVLNATCSLVATGGSDSTIKVWDIVNNYCTHNLKNAKGVMFTVVFAPKYTDQHYYLLGSGDDYHIHVWNLIDSSHVHALAGHDGKITGIVYTQDANRFISASRDKLVIIWNAATFQKERSIPVFEAIESIQLIHKFVDDQGISRKEMVATGGESGLIKLWNYHNGQLLHAQQNSLFKIESTQETSNYTLLSQLIYNRSKHELIAVSYDKDIVFYHLDDLEQPFRQLVGHNDEILEAKLLGSKQTHMAVATNSPKIKVFELSTSGCYFLTGHTDIVLALEVFPNDRHLMASSSKDNSVRVWQFSQDCRSALCLFFGVGHAHSVTSLACCTATAKETFFVSGSEDTTIKYWRLPSIRSFDDNHSDASLPTAIVSRATQSCHEKDVNSVDVAPNNELVATGSQDRTAKIWILPNFLLLGVVRGHKKGIWFVRFSPIDQILATGSADSTIKLWSIVDFNCLKTFQGHGSSVLRLTFIDQGGQILSSSSDGNLKIWNIKSNECVATFDAHEGKVWALDCSMDEDVLVTGGDDSTIKLWRDDTQEIVAKEETQREESIENEQLIQNLLHKNKWFKALKVAIKLEHPLRALQILKEMLLELRSYDQLIEKIGQLRRDQLLVLFEYSIRWNTNARHCVIAQCVLKAVIQQISPQELLQNPEARIRVQRLLPYTERHVARVDRVKQLVTFADFVYQQIQSIDTIHS